MFTISSVKATKPPTYAINDTLGEPVQGTFYEQELQSSENSPLLPRNLRGLVIGKSRCEAIFNLLFNPVD